MHLPLIIIKNTPRRPNQQSFSALTFSIASSLDLHYLLAATVSPPKCECILISDNLFAAESFPVGLHFFAGKNACLDVFQASEVSDKVMIFQLHVCKNR